MHTYTWDEYYEKFYDWAQSTQVHNLSALTSLGSADEVGEIIIELQFNIPASNRLLKKAVEAKLEFIAYDLIEFLCMNDKELATEAVYNSANRLRAKDMERLYGEVEDKVIIEICSKRNLPLPEALGEEEDDFYFYDTVCYGKPKKFRLFERLFDLFYMEGEINKSNRKKHNGRCNGDCANCPPHYGYRHDRWYYGHDHVHGCEFGGNKGSGSMD